MRELNFITSLLPVIGCPLLVARYVLSAAGCLLLAARYVLSAAGCLPPALPAAC